MAKGYWLARVDVTNPDGYKPLRRHDPTDLQEVRRPLRHARRPRRKRRRREPLAQRDHRISRLRHRARLLPLAGIQRGQEAARLGFARRHRRAGRLRRPAAVGKQARQADIGGCYDARGPSTSGRKLAIYLLPPCNSWRNLAWNVWFS